MTTDEIKESFKDIKVLGKSDIKYVNSNNQNVTDDNFVCFI